MKDKLFDKKQSCFLPHKVRNLIYLTGIYLVLALTACKTTSALPTHISPATVTVTQTQSHPLRPSVTVVPNPTVTKTVEPTWPPLPTSTPLVPTPATGQTYQLTRWTPEKAEKLIQYLDEYPVSQLQGFSYLYYRAFRYKGLAEIESAYRFPNAEQASTWRQDGAYNLYFSGNWDINQLYTSLITAALNRQETSLDDLPVWFANAEPRLSLEVIPAEPPPGYQKSAVVHIHTNERSGFDGGLAFWLLQNGSIFSGFTLSNEDSDSYHEMASKVRTLDITGDNVPEVVIQHDSSDWPDIHIGSLSIYRLDQVPPSKVNFDIPFPNSSIAELSVDKSRSIPTITFTVTKCKTFKVDWQYEWQGDQLGFVQVIPPPVEVMTQNPECTRTLVDSLSSERFLGNRASLETYKQLLDLPFIASVEIGSGYTLYTEKDRFSLAMYLSDHSDETGANEQIEKIRSGTDTSLAKWRRDALMYFSARRDQHALLQFCLTAEQCEDFLNFSERIALVPPDRFSEIDTLLLQMGFDFSLSGNYDFDRDGQSEKWLFFQNGCGSTFWVLANYKEGTKGCLAARICLPDEIQIDEKVNILPLPPSGGLPEYQVSITGQEQASEKFLYYPLNQKDPTINRRQAEQMIDTLQNQLLLGQISPAEAEKQVKYIQSLPLQPDSELPEIQANLLYLLGLAQELNGENNQAAQTYLEVWKTFPNVPYSVMAFAKLEAVP